MIRILHLSDFHLNPKTLNDWDNFLSKALLEKLSELSSEKEIDLVVFTGDLIDRGGRDFNNVEDAFDKFQNKVIHPILENLSIENNRFIIIPGNHDIVRELDSEYIEIGLRHSLSNTEKVNEFVENAIKTNNTEGIKRIIPFNNFKNNFYTSDSDCNLTLLESNFRYNIDDYTIGVSALNSSWRCFDDKDKGRLFISDEQLARSTKYIKNCNLKIALSHHPIDWLSDVEKKTIISHLTQDYNILFTGHTHDGGSNIYNTFNGSLFINNCPSGLNNIRSNDRNYSNGFSLIDISKSIETLRCNYFRYNHDQKKFVLNTDLATNGVFETTIPKSQSAKDIRLEEQILENIKEEHLSDMNNHLISNKSEIGPKSIKEAFILPPIENNRITSSDIENETLSIQTITECSNDLIIYGNSESGKTTLLYRLVIEYIDRYEFLRKIPVYVNFHEIGNKRIETCIKEYLQCNTKNANFLLKENKIVLLIDNFSFTSSSIPKLKKLNTFKSLNKYPNLQIIATSASNFTSVPNPIYLSDCKIPFRDYYIKSLQSSHIKKIIKSWNSPGYENEPVLFVDKMIDSFRSYSLPSNPMSVSLYLWSLENKDRKPINHAVLLEIYLEIILEKISEQNIYRDRFDFTNKTQLLSKIAHEMYIQDNGNYSITYSSFIEIIETYLNDLVGFDFEADKIAEYFLNRKIFVKYQSNRIKFSFSSFFHFFLSKRMLFNNEFKQHVLNQEEYYKFGKEIDYYTALTRSDKKLLEHFLDIFEKEFLESKQILNEVDVDRFFTEIGEFYTPKAEKLDLNELKNHRPSAEMIEEFENKKLKEIENAGEIMRKYSSKSLEQILIIFCNVLRNSEGVEDLDLKKKAYNSLIKATIVWTILFREYILEFVIKNKSYPPPIPSEFDLIYVLRTVPYHTQLGLFKHLGTNKLAAVINDKIINDEKDNLSDVEKFLSIVLYTDISGQNYKKILKNGLKEVKNNVVRDYYLYKLIEYYYKRSKPGSENEKFYIDLLTDLKIKSQSNLTSKMRESIKRSLAKGKTTFLKQSN
ncbi:MAG: metallophosphoesterase [bacterium]|nr:metallophosphoesterase [bacterium]